MLIGSGTFMLFDLSGSGVGLMTFWCGFAPGLERGFLCLSVSSIT